MASVPPTARVVVIGAGIVGNSLVHHLARLGWRDIVQIDKGALPNPGGSTGHASNFIFPVDHSREMTDLTLDSVRQYKELGVFTESGGYEVARTEERMEELRRRMSSARAWGIEAELVSPDHVVAKVPFLDKDKILGAFWMPSVGVVDSLRAGTLMRESALALGALTVVPTVEVTGLDVEQGRIRRVRTSGGDIEAETVVIACGVWSPKIAEMAGAAIPLTPAVHQMISVGPIPQLAEREGEISFPIIRDMDTFCYERQHGADMEVGSYAHRAILHNPEDIPSIEQSRLSPTEMPFTEDDFDPQLEQALELMPEALGADGAEIRYAINGLLSLTPDGLPILGETPEVKGLWSAAAVWIKEGPGHRPRRGRVDDPRPVRDRRPPLRHRALLPAPAHPRARALAHLARRSTRPTASCTRASSGTASAASGWPRCTRPSGRPARSSSRPPAGNARCGTPATRRCSPSTATRSCRASTSGTPAGGRRSSTPSTWPCASGPASSTCPRSRSSTSSGPGPRTRCRASWWPRPTCREGRVIYTPVLDAKGGFRSDLTVMRLAHDRYRVVTGGAHGMADLKWFADHLPADGTAQIVDVTSAYTTIGLWGPRARDILGSLTDDDVSDSGFGFLTCRNIEVGSTAVLASRISYVGELGWELYVADGAGRPAVAAAARGRPAARRRPGRHRGLRHHRPDREGLPRLRVRAGRRAHHRRGRHAAAQGQGGELRRPRRLPRPARGGAAGGALHA